MQEGNMNSQLSGKNESFKSGYVAIVGRPNVGKSTLINNFLRFKLSIVTPKPQTTRHRVLGILNGENYQVIFLDTPGIMEKEKYELHKLMVKRAIEAIDEADLVVFMVEPYDPTEGDLKILDAIRERNKKTILAINKIDKPLSIAVMGCIVNGPGEAADADLAVCAAKNKAYIYKKGRKIATVPENKLTTTLLHLWRGARHPSSPSRRLTMKRVCQKDYTFEDRNLHSH